MTDQELLASPSGFATGALGLSLYDWQARAVEPLKRATGPNARQINIAVVTPNGSGKDDRIIPAAAYWWLFWHRRGKVAITSKSDLQLTTQTIPSLDKHWPKFGWGQPVTSPRYHLKTTTGGTLTAFVSNAAGRVEGWHKEDDCDGPLLQIVNEAKSVDEDIYQGLDRWTVNARLWVSSPGVIGQGRFYDCFAKDAAQWIRVQAGLADCPHIPQERIDYIRNTYGENHPITRSTLYGEFMEQDELDRYIVTHGQLERCILNPPPFRPGIRIAFCDFAGGGDENVIALRDGNKITLEAHWREKDKLAAVGRFIQHFRRLGLKEQDIWGDAAAKDMLDLLHEAGWTIHRQNFGSPSKTDIYVSWGAQAWLEAANQIEKCEIILPNDDVLRAQLTSRQKTITSHGKLAIEEKYQMAKRNLPSPDRADAVVGALAVWDASAVYKEPFRVPGDYFTNPDYFAAEEHNEVMDSIGANAGL